METGRLLTSDEISQLINQQCRAEDWSKIRVDTNFRVKYVTQTTFSGEIYLGSFGKKLTLPGGIPVESSICRAHLHNCHISDNVFIRHISQYIANYSIGEGTIIDNVGLLYTEGDSSFGNGTSVSVLDETGGRAVTIYEGISAQTAWLSVMNFHNPVLTSAINKLALDKARSLRSTRGTIGSACSIRNSGTLRNLRIGNGCEIDGASILDDGSLCSSVSAFQGENNDPMLTTAYVGANVIARHFILAPGAVVKDGVQLERCFVGEAAELSKGFSTHDSLFFSNCQMENGEACASFLGPYTVSMHKGTLMVGGMFSFCNFGSSSNQSNHFYKLGPMHSGTLERGCKTGSGAYLLWPSRVGAFTFIKGAHSDHPETTDFPYSYLIEDNGKSYLTPGAAIRSVGTLRDEMKWPQRDKRTTLIPADKICFESSNPSTACALVRGLAKLQELALSKESEYRLNGCFIRSSAVVRGIKLYQTALDIFKGTMLIRQLEHLQEDQYDPQSLLKNLLNHAQSISDKWLDVSGLLVPESELQKMIDRIQGGQMHGVEDIENTWESLYLNYREQAWQCALNHSARDLGKTASEMTLSDFSGILDRWESALSSMYKTMLLDADYELNMLQQHSPGGLKPEHPFVKVLQRLIDELPVKTEACKSMFIG